MAPATHYRLALQRSASRLCLPRARAVRVRLARQVYHAFARRRVCVPRPAALADPDLFHLRGRGEPGVRARHHVSAEVRVSGVGAGLSCRGFRLVRAQVHARHRTSGTGPAVRPAARDRAIVDSRDDRARHRGHRLLEAEPTLHQAAAAYGQIG